jgi:hypothetical protein
LDGGDPAAGVAVARRAVDVLLTAQNPRETLLPSARPWLLRARAQRGAGEFVDYGVRAATAHEAALDLSLCVVSTVFTAVCSAHSCADRKESSELEVITEANLAQLYDALHAEWSQKLSEGLDHLRNEMDIDHAAAANVLAQYGRERETAELPERSNSHLESAGPADVTTPQSTKVAETGPYLFHFEGAVYRVLFEDEPGTIDAALAGAGYIHRLLQQPRIPLKATDLVGAVASLDSGQADQVQNQESLGNLRKRRAQLMEDLPAPDAPEYPVMYEEIRPEVEQIDAEVRHLTGLGGKARRNRPNDSARVRATKSIRLVIDKCRTEYELSRLAEHLNKHIRTGDECIYSPPDPPPNWQF